MSSLYSLAASGCADAHGYSSTLHTTPRPNARAGGPGHERKVSTYSWPSVADPVHQQSASKVPYPCSIEEGRGKRNLFNSQRQPLGGKPRQYWSPSAVREREIIEARRCYAVPRCSPKLDYKIVPVPPSTHSQIIPNSTPGRPGSASLREMASSFSGSRGSGPHPLAVENDNSENEMTPYELRELLQALEMAAIDVERQFGPGARDLVNNILSSVEDMRKYAIFLVAHIREQTGTIKGLESENSAHMRNELNVKHEKIGWARKEEALNDKINGLNEQVARYRKSNLFKCDACSHVFYTNAALEDHERVIHKKGAPKMRCEACGKEFVMRGPFGNHQQRLCPKLYGQPPAGGRDDAPSYGPLSPLPQVTGPTSPATLAHSQLHTALASQPEPSQPLPPDVTLGPPFPDSFAPQLPRPEFPTSYLPPTHPPPPHLPPDQNTPSNTTDAVSPCFSPPSPGTPVHYLPPQPMPSQATSHYFSNPFSPVPQHHPQAAAGFLHDREILHQAAQETRVPAWSSHSAFQQPQLFPGDGRRPSDPYPFGVHHPFHPQPAVSDNDGPPAKRRRRSDQIGPPRPLLPALLAPPERPGPGQAACSSSSPPPPSPPQDSLPSSDFAPSAAYPGGGISPGPTSPGLVPAPFQDRDQGPGSAWTFHRVDEYNGAPVPILLQSRPEFRAATGYWGQYGYRYQGSVP
ncbi:hypothetical protein B0T25DRAFT_359670 [Lasiosphaeria hispida]|uniref:C2H2-type domain-containing protein n=1 Tax=Lasiosphaeria hispida TaxID=260671 RepID=A0AAJ0H7K6_9PEZI|nr:hypothetical protein B0T25DRAFT_359670 [Lasiosphaeria hispida]